MIASVAFLACLAFAAPEQNPGRHLISEPLFKTIAEEYSGERASENVRRIVEHHRIQGSPMMAAAAQTVVLAELTKHGLEAKLDTYLSDGQVRYGTFVSPMAWEIASGELWV